MDRTRVHSPFPRKAALIPNWPQCLRSMQRPLARLISAKQYQSPILSFCFHFEMGYRLLYGKVIARFACITPFLKISPISSVRGSFLGAVASGSGRCGLCVGQGCGRVNDGDFLYHFNFDFLYYTCPAFHPTKDTRRVIRFRRVKTTVATYRAGNF